ncbi:hypothetical protein C7447_1011106 [Tenacibaculum adriaticum]|uniref:tRNA (Guanine-N1)-methyltransferase n=1 Tax=Tenacibaculum adriaticum TaxID=413713 RepID=A0A5S5E1F9_9FLAO|nr:hypothetical protein [Tenacibaculum adriaticum]TYQ00490.1 hypothetical protein C7447_1011106 [Tenacibaculum adriaticum]
MKFFKLLIVLLFSTSVIAQTNLSKQQLDSLPNTIENQFLKVYKNASNWQEYKMIKRVNFLNFQKNILDSVSIIKKDVLSKQESINQQASTIISLNDNISKLNEDLSIAISKEDAISLFGMQLNKAVYNTLLWGIILGLLAGMFFFLFKFKNSNILTNEAKKNLAVIEQEFEVHRKKAIEKEQKLRRQLQDEINKQRGV